MNEDPAQASGLLNTWCNLHRQGHAVRKPGNAPARLETWAKERFPAFLARVPLNAANYTGTVASTLHDISSPHRGLALLMTRHAGEPVWLRRIGYTVWSRHVYSFARWRREAGSMP
ncbi:MAG: hypothetical protein P1V36_08420, partial [Planctomycetota bacterium]|nr:hypothetical protein [Planctomycetota bacterium]